MDEMCTTPRPLVEQSSTIVSRENFFGQEKVKHHRVHLGQLSWEQRFYNNILTDIMVMDMDIHPNLRLGNTNQQERCANFSVASTSVST